MKKRILVGIVFLAFVSLSNAQSSYTGAIGLGIDFFEDVTLVGPSGKYFFAENHVGQADLGFEENVTAITLLYSYHDQFSGAPGLRWYAGFGPSVLFLDDDIGGGTEIALRPHAGLDFKINGVPLAFSFDWRPFLGLGDLNNEVGAFGVGFRYAFD